MKHFFLIKFIYINKNNHNFKNHYFINICFNDNNYLIINLTIIKFVLKLYLNIVNLINIYHKYSYNVNLTKLY